MYKKKVGLIIPHLQSGGAERVISLTSQLLKEEGYEVYIFLFDVQNISYPYQGKLIDLKSKAGKNLFIKVIKRISRILKLSYYKYKYNLDVVISFLYSANSVNYHSIGRAEKILACRGYRDYIGNGKKYSKMLKSIDAFIVQTERMKSDFINDFNADASKISVVYNPFHVNEIKEKSSESIETDIQKFIDTHKTICTVGAFKKDKGYWHLIKAFILVKKTVPNVGLIFIGHRGEMEKEIKNMAIKTNYSNDILFLGYQENPFKYISKCDLYICSSLNEGFPNALVEAMACGTTVLSTDCKTGPTEILSESYNEKTTDEIMFADYGILSPELERVINYNIEVITISEKIIGKAISDTLINEEIIKNYAKLSVKRVQSYNSTKYIEILNKIIANISISRKSNL